MMNFFRLLILITTIAFSCDRTQEHIAEVPEKPSPDSAQFTLINPGQSGLNFNNELSEGPNTNILMYEYFYNGAGVATADFNGDGLIDIYFTSNMQDNKLFLNKGNLKFEDVTSASGAGGRPGPWKTGVSVADVNGDNRLDIFVCYSGMVKEENRTNQLFINQANNAQNVPTFLESSNAYGLNTPSFTNQAYFFDYDRDSDLDLLLLNHNPVNLPILNETSTASMLAKDDVQKGVRLLRQANGKFTDVTRSSGINGSALTYGLGAGVSDLNGDGYPDIYISNDYSVPDYLYINNGNGSFTNKLQEAMGHTSQFSMGNDVADVNNDGLPEVFTLDMLPEDNKRQKLLMAPDNYAKFDLNVRSGFYYQYMRNMFHLNNGDGTFSEIGQLAGISNTDWSWAALFADYDNDGFKDLLVTNGYVRDYTNLDFIKYMDGYVKSKGRLMREDVRGIIEHMPASNVVNYIFSNENGSSFKNRTKAWGMHRASNSNGAAYADLDNDGDLDIIVNNINQNAFLYRNNSNLSGSTYSFSVKLEGSGLNTAGLGAKVTVWQSGRMQVVEQMPTRGYLSTVSPVLHFGLGASRTIDSLSVRWPNGKQQVVTNVTGNTIVLKEDDAKPSRIKKRQDRPIFDLAKAPFNVENASLDINDFKRQPLLLTQFSQGDRKMVKGDVNNDRLDDVFICGGNGYAAALFIQTTNNTFVKLDVTTFDQFKNLNDADAVFADLNADGFQDLYVATGGYHQFAPDDALLNDRVYLNDGKGSFSYAPKWVDSVRGSKGTVAAGDYNLDGLTDIFVGGRVVPGRYPETPESFLLINSGSELIDQTMTIAPQVRKIGMVTDAITLDVNRDGRADLAMAGEWMRLSILLNENGKLVDRTSDYFTKSYAGWWNSLDTADFNHDGYVDLIAGNLGLNSQCKASDNNPAELYFKDFDNNGSVDPLLTIYLQGKQYPYLTRDELLEQIGSMRSTFTDYQSYANATLTDFIPEQQLAEAGHLRANDFETRVFLGSTEGKFSPVTLPLEAQYAPVYASWSMDVDHDGKLDLLLCGNNSKTKIKLGKYDANYGVLLKGDGKGGFSYVNQSMSGLSLKNDIRSIQHIGEFVVFGSTSASPIAYRLKSSQRLNAPLAILQEPNNTLNK